MTAAKPRKRIARPDLPPHVYQDKARGKVIFYFWYGKGYRKERIRAEYDTGLWHTIIGKLKDEPKEYFLPKAEAVASDHSQQTTKAPHGSFEWAFNRVCREADCWEELGENTQKTYGNLLKQVFKNERTDSTDPNSPFYRVVPVVALTTEAIQILPDRWADRGVDPKQLIKALHKSFEGMVEIRILEVDISQGLRRVSRRLAKKRAKAKRAKAFDGEEAEDWESHCATPEEVERWRQVYPIGTVERLWLELGVTLGLARVDMVQAGPKNIIRKNGRVYLSYCRQKTGTAAVIDITDSPLLDIIAATKVIGHRTWLVSMSNRRKGQPLRANSLGNAFTKARNAIPGFNKRMTIHSWRRRCATDKAEAGYTASQLMHAMGWTSIALAELYTRAADKLKSATAASRLTAGTPLL